jgi:hypothetical protein
MSDEIRGVIERVRHFLESAVLQANANLAADDEDDEPASRGERSEPDERMTEAFRGFAAG